MDLITAILALAQSGLKLANTLAERAEAKRKIEHGIDKQVRESLGKAHEQISKAISARRDARRKFERDGLPKDYRYFRD